MTLLELAERAEAATIDQQHPVLRDAWIAVYGKDANWHPFIDLLHAGAFLDAAMTLVLEPEKGVSVWRSPRDGGLCCATVHHGLVAEARTMPLALCAAALKARAASVDRSPQGGDRETGRHAKHESAASEAGDAPPPAPSLQTPQGGDS